MVFVADGRLKMDLVRLGRELEKKMADLGVKVYGRYSKTPDAPIVVDDELRALMRDIAKIQADVEKSQQEYEAEKKESPLTCWELLGGPLVARYFFPLRPGSSSGMPFAHKGQAEGS